ncbi:hypothetical protein [Streptomyces mirabilis]|uniref:Uncharacterized protein n=1 Tax=Streptomyces mirabilis TaxID=68239 RepID=A0A1I2VQ40_9ACTN|nr:hypothetical protein [Streptomyces mirabilis]SFG91445.1 hypothetical protein SAMN02787118_1334 [Streptomyces mirabilis]
MTATEAERRHAIDMEKEEVETQRAATKRSMDGMGAGLERVRTMLVSMAPVAAWLTPAGI